jgi:hypothetical protein
MKTEVGRNWINLSIFINCLAGKCPFLGPNGHHHERSAFSTSLDHPPFSLDSNFMNIFEQI